MEKVLEVLPVLIILAWNVPKKSLTFPRLVGCSVWALNGLLKKVNATNRIGKKKAFNFLVVVKIVKFRIIKKYLEKNNYSVEIKFVNLFYQHIHGPKKALYFVTLLKF